jgi:hypothetical protein
MWMSDNVDAMRRFALAFVIAWAIALLLGLLAFGAQVVVGENAMYAMDGGSAPPQQLAAEFLDAVAQAAPGAAIRAAVFVGIALLLAGLAARLFPRTRLLSYAVAGAMVPMVVLGAQDWQLHWMSGSIGAVALLAAAPFAHPK